MIIFLQRNLTLDEHTEIGCELQRSPLVASNHVVKNVESGTEKLTGVGSGGSKVSGVDGHTTSIFRCIADRKNSTFISVYRITGYDTPGHEKILLTQLWVFTSHLHPSLHHQQPNPKSFHGMTSPSELGQVSNGCQINIGSNIQENNLETTRGTKSVYKGRQALSKSSL